MLLNDFLRQECPWSIFLNTHPLILLSPQFLSIIEVNLIKRVALPIYMIRINFRLSPVVHYINDAPHTLLGHLVVLIYVEHVVGVILEARVRIGLVHIVADDVVLV